MKLKPRFFSAAIAMVITAVSVPNISTARAAGSGVFINEICTQNKSCLADSYGVYSDWIELYNAGSSDADLSGFGLSDDETMPSK